MRNNQQTDYAQFAALFYRDGQVAIVELITDARLAHAMQLLYTTGLPLKTVAARVGYRSLGSFTKRFSARYGMDPGAIGNS